MNRVFFIQVIFTSNFLLRSYLYFCLCDKIDVEAWSDCQWFCKGPVTFGIILLNFFHWFVCLFFYKIFPAAKMSFRNVYRHQKKHFSFFSLGWFFFILVFGLFFWFFFCGKNRVDFFSILFYMLLILNRGEDFL